MFIATFGACIAVIIACYTAKMTVKTTIKKRLFDLLVSLSFMIMVVLFSHYASTTVELKKTQNERKQIYEKIDYDVYKVKQ